MADVIDPFVGDAFTLAQMTTSINRFDYLPGRLGQLGIFDEQGVPSRTVIIEEDYGTLKLIPTAPWGGVPTPNTPDKRKARPFIIPHVPVSDAVLAEELQDLRAYTNGMTPSQARMSVEALRDRKNLSMRRKLEATLEFHRAGALQGIIYDADGTSVIYNLFTEFGQTQQTANLLLNTATTNVKAQIAAAIRLSINKLGNQPFTGWRAVVGNSLWDKLNGHPNFEKFYLKSNDVRLLREADIVYGALSFGGVMWENYRGSVGGVDFVPSTKGYLFPVGVPGLFMTFYGPSDYIDRVNQVPDPNGLPIEARAEAKPMGKGLDLEAQMNPLNISTRPEAVIELHENT